MKLGNPKSDCIYKTYFRSGIHSEESPNFISRKTKNSERDTKFGHILDKTTEDNKMNYM